MKHFCFVVFLSIFIVQQAHATTYVPSPDELSPPESLPDEPVPVPPPYNPPFPFPPTPPPPPPVCTPSIETSSILFAYELRSAYASFSNQASGCVLHKVLINVVREVWMDFLEQSEATTTVWVEVYITQADVCTGGVANLYSGVSFLPGKPRGDIFTVGEFLNDAHIWAPVQVCDENEPKICFWVVTNLDIKATPELPSAVRTELFDVDGNLSTSDYEWRNAIANGTLVRLDTRENLLSAAGSDISWIDGHHDRVYER